MGTNRGLVLVLLLYCCFEGCVAPGKGEGEAAGKKKKTYKKTEHPLSAGLKSEIAAKRAKEFVDLLKKQVHLKRLLTGRPCMFMHPGSSPGAADGNLPSLAAGVGIREKETLQFSDDDYTLFPGFDPVLSRTTVKFTLTAKVGVAFFPERCRWITQENSNPSFYLPTIADLETAALGSGKLELPSITCEKEKGKDSGIMEWNGNPPADGTFDRDSFKMAPRLEGVYPRKYCGEDAYIQVGTFVKFEGVVEAGAQKTLICQKAYEDVDKKNYEIRDYDPIPILDVRCAKPYDVNKQEPYIVDNDYKVKREFGQ